MSYETERAPLEGKQLHPWQRRIADNLDSQPEKKKIYWYYSRGGAGKTALVRHLAMTRNDVLQVFTRDANNVTLRPTDRVILFDVNDIQDEDRDVPYDKIKEFKDGRVKQRNQVQTFDAPHVYAFALFPPNKSRLEGYDVEVHDIDNE